MRQRFIRENVEINKQKLQPITAVCVDITCIGLSSQEYERLSWKVLLRTGAQTNKKQQEYVQLNTALFKHH